MLKGLKEFLVILKCSNLSFGGVTQQLDEFDESNQ